MSPSICVDLQLCGKKKRIQRKEEEEKPVGNRGFYLRTFVAGRDISLQQRAGCV